MPKKGAPTRRYRQSQQLRLTRSAVTGRCGDACWGCESWRVHAAGTPEVVTAIKRTSSERMRSDVMELTVTTGAGDVRSAGDRVPYALEMWVEAHPYKTWQKLSVSAGGKHTDSVWQYLRAEAVDRVPTCASMQEPWVPCYTSMRKIGSPHHISIQKLTSCAGTICHVLVLSTGAVRESRTVQKLLVKLSASMQRLWVAHCAAMLGHLLGLNYAAAVGQVLRFYAGAVVVYCVWIQGVFRSYTVPQYHSL